MKLDFRLGIAAGLMLTVLHPVGVAAQAVGPSSLPLVKLHDTHTSAAGPAVTRFVDQDVFVARDGKMVSLTVAADLLTGSGFTTTLVNGTGSADAVAALRTAFFEGRVSQLSGSCGAELMPLGSTFSFGISWFGNGSRTSHATITNEGAPAGACTQQELGILQAIEAFQAGVIADPATHVSSSACTSDRQCPDGLLCCNPCPFGPPFACADFCMRPASTGRCPLG